MSATRISTLASIAILAGTLGWLVLHAAYTRMPPLPWTAAATLALLAVAEAVSALNVRARLRRKPGTRPVNPLAVARLAVLAKATAYTAALIFGIFAGVLCYVLPDLGRGVGQHDALVSGGTCGVALLLAGAALFLEYACRVPKRPDAPDGDARRDDRS